MSSRKNERLAQTMNHVNMIEMERMIYKGSLK